MSYDRLNPKEQEMFLDAATFFNNSTWNLQTAKFCWREIYGNFQSIRWKTLVHLFLVYNVSEEDCIQMHKQMRSLGVKLASAWEYKRICRTWTEKNVSFPSLIPPMEETKVCDYVQKLPISRFRLLSRVLGLVRYRLLM